MELNEETVDAHFELMTNPKKYLLEFRPLAECFEPAEEFTASHVLYEDYSKHENPQVAKVFFYIVFERVFGAVTGKDKKGNGGYQLRFKKRDVPQCICEGCLEIVASVTVAKDDELLCDSCEIGQKPDLEQDPTPEQTTLLTKQRDHFNQWRADESLRQRRYSSVAKNRKEWICNRCDTLVEKGKGIEHSYSADMKISISLCLSCVSVLEKK